MEEKMKEGRRGKKEKKGRRRKCHTVL